MFSVFYGNTKYDLKIAGSPSRRPTETLPLEKCAFNGAGRAKINYSNFLFIYIAFLK